MSEAGRPAPTDHPIHEIFAERWSARAIDPDRAVPREAVMRMLEAARWAASCFNDQPWHYLIWDRERDAQAWEKAMACLAEKNQQWARRAPVLLLSVADTEFDHNGKPNRFGEHDTGAASANLHAQGVHQGLVVHQMAGYDADRAREEFSIPERYRPMAMIAVGYPAPVEILDEEFQDKETAARQRQPISEWLHENRWD